MQEYLSEDKSRCSGQLNGIGVYCHLRFNCSRFLQYQQDLREKKQTKVINPNPFEDLNCTLFIKNK
jgi:hypothetical protein